MTSDRIANVSGDERCPTCADTPGRHGPSGMVVVAKRQEGGRLADEMGPCPSCEAGLRFEMRRWPNGYLQGREATVFPPVPDGRFLPRAESALRLRLLTRRMAGEQVNPLVGIDLREPGKRLAVLERAVAK